MPFDYNKWISRIHSWILYSIVLLFTVWDFTFTYFAMKTVQGAREANPLHALMMNLFGVQYFLYMAPVALLIIFLAMRFGGKLLEKGTKGIKGENHIAMMLIIIMSPNIIFNEMFPLFFNTSFVHWQHNWFGYFAAIVVIIYTIWLDHLVKKLKVR